MKFRLPFYISLFFSTFAVAIFVFYKKYIQFYSGIPLFDAFPLVIQDILVKLQLFQWKENSLVVSLDFLKAVALFIGLFFVLHAIISYFISLKTRVHRRQIQQAFRQYISDSVVDAILANPEAVALGGKNAYLTVSFLDIENFSELASEYAPQKLVPHLNEYFSEMSDIILKHSGTIDKYLGDSIMSFWGAPQIQEDHAIRACATVLDQQQKLIELRKKWKKEKKPEIRAKVGLACGDMIVGNIGSKGHFNYTVIGESVNLAARLEKLNSVYGTSLLVSEKIYHKAKHDFEFREIDEVILNGFKKTVRVFELLAKKGEMSAIQAELVSHYHEALEALRNKDQKTAQDAINHCLRIAAKDKPSQLLKEKIKEL